MIESTEQPRRTGWALAAERLTACWWQLLLVEFLFAGAGWIVLTLCLVFTGTDLLTARDALLLAAGGLGAAWSWSAKLRILDGGHGILSALRPDLRRIGWLAAWLAALDVTGLLDLLSSVDLATYADLVQSPAIGAVHLGGLYLQFAGALLPMAILLEGRGVRRAWQLTHGGRRTVLWVLPVVVLGAIASAVSRQVQVGTLLQHPMPSYLPLVLAGTLLTGVLLGALSAVFLYVAYRQCPPGTAAGLEQDRPAATVPSAA
ncbi:hypothetical protein [Kitasatospora sp. P5_F3]